MHTVMLAEDDEATRNLWYSVLTCAGYQVVPFEEGPALLRRLHFVKPDVLVLDAIMPSMDGIEVLAQARAHGFAGPAVLITAAPEIGEAERLTGKWCAVLLKPCDVLAVVGAVNEAVSRVTAVNARRHGRHHR